jgi:hypothetical protein
MQSTKRGRGRPPRRPEEGAIDKGTWRIGRRERFALRLLSRQSNTDEAVLLEQMIKERADRDLSAKELGRSWVDLYEPDEGIRTLKLFSLPRYRPSEDDETVKAFVAAHAPFFYSDDAQEVPYGERVFVLWPDIKAYSKAWISTRSKDPWSVAREMAAALKSAGASVPAGRGKW